MAKRPPDAVKVQNHPATLRLITQIEQFLLQWGEPTMRMGSGLEALTIIRSGWQVTAGWNDGYLAHLAYYVTPDEQPQVLKIRKKTAERLRAKLSRHYGKGRVKIISHRQGVSLAVYVA